MGSAAEITEPTTGTEKLQVEEEVEDEQIVELERKTSSFPHGKRPDSADGSTITTNHSSSSSFSEADLRNGQGEHVGIEHLDVPESPEKVTEIEFHEEHHDGNVFFDGEEGIWKCRHCDWTYREDSSLLCFDSKGSESADAETEAHESHTAEKKEPVVENGSASEDNKGPSREIEEVHEVDSPKEVDAVDQRAGEVIEEEVDIEGVEDYNVEKVLGNQETHDLFCPNCNSCITKRVILKKRRRKISHVPEDPKRVRRPDPVDPILRSEDNEPSAAGGDNVVHESFFYKCLSCLSIFIPKGVDSKPVPPMRNQTAGVDSKPVAPMEYPIAGVDPKPVAPMENQTAGVDSKPVASMENQIARVDSKPVAPSESVERLNTQPKPQEKATGHGNWFGSLFGFKNEEPSFHFQQGGAMPSIPEASLPRDNPSILGKETGSTANNPSKAPVPVQDGAVTSIKDASEISVSGDKKPVDTPWIQVANSNDTSKGVNNSGATTVENGKQLQVPSADEEQAQQKIDRNDASTADENQSTDKGRLSPIQPSHDMNISNIVTSGPDGVRVETIFHTEGVSHLFEGTGSSKPGFGLTNVTGVIDSGSGGPIRGIDIPPVPVSSREEGTLTEPLVRPAVARPVVEGRKVEILKSIVYGGLIEAITSLGVISSAAGSGASTLNILVLGLANLFGGLILIIHNLQELREEEPIRTTTTTEDNQTNIHEEDRYKRLLGRRENVTLHVTVAIISFIINGLLPPIVYYFSFSKTHNKDYKVASVFGASLLCIVLLAIAKAHVRSPRGSHLKSVLKYAMIAVSVSGISYVVGNFMDQLLEKYGWSDGSETPAGEMMLALMGRKAGSFGYSSSY